MLRSGTAFEKLFETSAAQPLVAEVGRRLRKRLGVDLQPALDWDSGMFTARAAACVAASACAVDGANALLFRTQ